MIHSIAILIVAGCTAEAPRDGDSTGGESENGLPRSIPAADEAQAGVARPLDIVLISIDTLRPDHLGTYGHDRPTSPNLDALAARSIVFENAFVQASWTLPSHMSMLTSTYPHTHQVQTESRTLPEDIATLAQTLDENGYDTVGFVTWVYLSARFGFDRGFDAYHELVPPEDQIDPSSHYSVKAEAAVDSVLAWGRSKAEARKAAVSDTKAGTRPGSPSRSGSAPDKRAEPFFLFLHLFDPHMDYEAPAEHVRAVGGDLNVDRRHGQYAFLRSYISGLSENVPSPSAKIREDARTLYDAEIHYTDAHVGRLLDRLGDLGLLRNAVVIVTSDHGEEFFEHGSMEGHQWTLYDEVVRVPLVIQVPGRNESKRIEDVVQSIDIAPTILGLAGIDRPASFEGRDLLRSEPAEGVAFSQIKRFTQRWSLRTETHKAIFTADTKTNRFGIPILPGYEVYDLRQDPGELRNLFEKSDSTAASLTRTLLGWARSARELQSTPAAELTREQKERLGSLGYTSP